MGGEERVNLKNADLVLLTFVRTEVKPCSVLGNVA